MKQHILEEQYYESKKLRRKLEDVGLMRYEDVTIGKMIEIIEERLSSVYFRRLKKEKKYQISIDPMELFMNGFKIVRTIDAEELCDALWEVTKIVLKDR